MGLGLEEAYLRLEPDYCLAKGRNKPKKSKYYKNIKFRCGKKMLETHVVSISWGGDK